MLGVHKDERTTKIFLSYLRMEKVIWRTTMKMDSVESSNLRGKLKLITRINDGDLRCDNKCKLPINKCKLSIVERLRVELIGKAPSVS